MIWKKALTAALLLSVATGDARAQSPAEQAILDRVVAHERSGMLAPEGYRVLERTIRTGPDGTAHVSILSSRMGQHGQQLGVFRRCWDVLRNGRIIDLEFEQTLANIPLRRGPATDGGCFYVRPARPPNAMRP